MATPDVEDDLKEIKKNIKQLQEGQGGGERPGFLRALKDYILDVKDTPQASVSKADEKESKGGALSEKDSKNLADIAKTNRVIAKALVESAREVRRERRRGVDPRIPSASTGATATSAATGTGGKQVAALLREPVTQQPQSEGAPDIPLPVPVTGTPGGGPKPPAGKPSLLGQGLQLGKDLLARAAPATPYALAAGALAAPFIAAGVSKRKIDEDPNAPGLEFQPYAMAVRGEAKTEGQAGRQNRDRAVGQMKWGEVKAFVESDMTDQELYEQLGRNRKELKQWLEQNKDGKTPYDKFTVAPAVASRAAESMIPWETPAAEPPPEVGVAPPITGMESAFVPTPSQTPTLADDLKNFYRRGVSGTAKAQDKQKIIDERAKQAGIMDATGKITDTEKYNALDEQVNRELEETGDAAPAANTRLFATSGTTSNNGNQQTYSVAGARKTLVGSDTLGALVTAKGLTSEDFRFMSLQEKGKEGGVSENVLNDFLAERISSGNLFKSDTYRITDNQGNTYDISKSDYNKIKKLADQGKVNEIDKILQPYVEAAARDTGPTRAMFEADQAQRARQDAFSDRSPLLKRPPPMDASARQQAEIEAGNLVEEDNAPQVEGDKPRKSSGLTKSEKRDIQQTKERNRKLREAAQSLGLDPNKVTGTFEGGKLTGIIDESGKEIDVSDRLSEEDKKSVNAARYMRDAMLGKQQPTPQVEPITQTGQVEPVAQPQQPQVQIASQQTATKQEGSRTTTTSEAKASGLPASDMRSTPQVEPSDKAQRPATATVMHSIEKFDAAALAEKDPELHRQFVERQREIERDLLRERQKELENLPPNRQSVARSKIQSEARMKAQQEFFSQAAQVGAASRQSTMASVNERGDSAVVRESIGNVNAPPRSIGGDLSRDSTINNDLQRQGNAPSSPPIVIQNNSAPSTQTTVTPPAQPRVNSSFTRVMDIRNFWD